MMEMKNIYIIIRDDKSIVGAIETLEMAKQFCELANSMNLGTKATYVKTKIMTLGDK